MTRRMIVAGNWKMNLDRKASESLGCKVASLAANAPEIDVAIFPSVVWLTAVVDAVGEAQLTIGSQDCYTQPAGAYTGEISPAEIATICGACLIGHSERRHLLAEPDELVAAKLRAAIAAGLGVYLCVGETLDEREAGNAEVTVERQLEAALDDLPHGDLPQLVLAYEPVWAIGTGRAATPDDAQEMSAFVREWMQARFGDAGSKVRILYGGSVSPDNASEIFKQPDVDGGLIGGASLKYDAFEAIVKAAVASTRM